LTITARRELAPVVAVVRLEEEDLVPRIEERHERRR
jgi:hypothetical protein